jgi:hypothetical protein
MDLPCASGSGRTKARRSEPWGCGIGETASALDRALLPSVTLPLRAWWPRVSAREDLLHVAEVALPLSFEPHKVVFRERDDSDT